MCVTYYRKRMKEESIFVIFDNDYLSKPCAPICSARWISRASLLRWCSSSFLVVWEIHHFFCIRRPGTWRPFSLLPFGVWPGCRVDVRVRIELYDFSCRSTSSCVGTRPWRSCCRAGTATNNLPTRICSSLPFGFTGLWLDYGRGRGFRTGKAMSPLTGGSIVFFAILEILGSDRRDWKGIRAYMWRRSSIDAWIYIQSNALRTKRILY